MKVVTRVLLLLTGVFLMAAGPLWGQSTEIIKEKKIATKTVQEYFIDKGLDEPVIESIEKFNERGDLIEIQEFNSKGEVKLWEKYTYDQEGRVLEEVFLDSRGRIEHTEKSIYSDGLKIEKQYFNNKNKLYKRKVYEYEYRN
jgi:hypothetical protein